MKKLLLASVLKPVDDIRHYHKLAVSIRKTNKYEIHIIGNETKFPSSFQDIIFHPFKIQGSIRQRISAHLHFAKKIKHLKPHIIIVAALELLPIVVIFKRFYKFKIIIDLQENYQANIKYQQVYSFAAKALLRSATHGMQHLCFGSVDEFWLAEKSYEKMVKKFSDKSIVLENKSLPIRSNNSKITKVDDPLVLLFSGTISEYSGIRNAIQIWKLFHQKYKNTRLIIIGVCWDKDLKKWLKNESKKYSEIVLFVESTPIAHQHIEAQIEQAHLGLVTYHPNDDSINRMPTKCFEYASARLPYLIQDSTSWAIRGIKIGGAIPKNFNNIDIEEVISTLLRHDHLFDNIKESPLWKSEESKLLNSKIL